MPDDIFRQNFRAYLYHGYWTQPVNGKAAIIKDWSNTDYNFSPDKIAGWEEKYAFCNIALQAGSPFPDGSRLGFLDGDVNSHVPLLNSIIGDPPVCARYGSKGIAILVRTVPGLKNEKIKSEFRENGIVLECLFERSLLVIPPSIHPVTQKPYTWIGKPLLEADYRDLPLIGE